MSEVQNAPVDGEEKVPVQPIKTYKSTITALFVLFAVYACLLVFGIPQKWTHAQFDHHSVSESVEVGEIPELLDEAEQKDADAESQAIPVSEDSTAAETSVSKETETEHGAVHYPPLWTSIPFVVLLLCIAILPLVPPLAHWWESNLHRFIVAAILGAVTLAYYAFVCDFPIDMHWPAHKVIDVQAGPFAKGGAVFVNAILGEYVSFIVLLFSLFCITGGIRISGDLKASPLVNSAILAIGAFLASFVGTTGAAMLLIRLLLETNIDRKHKVHIFVFFIFCVCNVGGCLLPIGDPPLFLGYLRGVGFLWTFHLWMEWLFVCGILIALFFLIDTFLFYPKEGELDLLKDRLKRTPLRVEGAFPNVLCLLGVILAVMLLDPAQEFLSLFGVKTGVYPPMFLREIVQLAMVAISFIYGSNAIRARNAFNFGAILEVAALFFGIFICMQAPLQILNAKGAQIAETVHEYGSKIKLNEPKEFFWISGTLSSVLDNAPTYVVFFETARAASEGELEEAIKAGDSDKAATIQAAIDEGQRQAGVPIPLDLLIAVSLGSVFMGAMTYIGNGPNFMVKAIAEENGVKMPSFFGYMGYSVCILLPILIVMTVIFL